MFETNTVDAATRYSPAFMRTHLGASQWAAACGMDPYVEPLALWERFHGLAPQWVAEVGSGADLGNRLEASIAEVAAHRLGAELESCKTVINPAKPWQCATPDRLVYGAPETVQVKTVGLVSDAYQARMQWGDEGTDEVPDHYAVQVQAEMLVCRRAGLHVERTHIAALIAGRGVCMFVVPFIEDLAEMLDARVSSWWQRHIVDAVRPEASTWALAAHVSRFTGTNDTPMTSTDPDDAAAVEAYTAAHAVEKSAKEDKQRASNTLCLRMREHTVLNVHRDGKPWAQVPWRHRAGRTAVDWEAIARTLHSQANGAEPLESLVEKHTKQVSEPTRVFGPIKILNKGKA